MIFQGLKSNVVEDARWSTAIDRVSEPVEMWQDIVGMNDTLSMSDVSKFRVLEWGRMEVKH